MRSGEHRKQAVLVGGCASRRNLFRRLGGWLRTNCSRRWPGLAQMTPDLTALPALVMITHPSPPMQPGVGVQRRGLHSLRALPARPVLCKAKYNAARTRLARSHQPLPYGHLARPGALTDWQAWQRELERYVTAAAPAACPQVWIGRIPKLETLLVENKVEVRLK